GPTCPQLTPVRCPSREVGLAAADLLLKRGSGSENLKELQSFQLELIVRESTRSV
ncbi:MAG TPA: LacI family transcriptional regulator, partial [Hyphomonas atlantica]|nr:LacI family transcriptional regulator [Hyphomonas atlantica]